MLMEGVQCANLYSKQGEIIWLIVNSESMLYDEHPRTFAIDTPSWSWMTTVIVFNPLNMHCYSFPLRTIAFSITEADVSTDVCFIGQCPLSQSKKTFDVSQSPCL